jgi:hypothetical protein
MAMAFAEMHDAFAVKGPKKGDVGRSQTGNNLGRVYLRAIPNLAWKP